MGSDAILENHRLKTLPFANYILGGVTMRSEVLRQMMMFLIFSCGWEHDCFGSDVFPAKPAWNADTDFRMFAIDTGVMYDSCSSKAPWGAKSWGVENSSFQGDGNYKLTAARFRNNGENAYLYGKNLQPGRVWGNVRYVQGDIWGGSSCGPRQYNIPQPQSLRDKHLVLEFDCLLDTANLLTPQDSWIMAAVNLWLSGEIMPSGKDLEGRKPLVVDLYIYHTSNMPSAPLARESGDAFHLPMELQRAEVGHWGRWRIDLTQAMEEAIRKGFPDLQKLKTGQFILDDLSLYQIDFVLEIVNAEAAATIDNFRLLVY